jgi:hypothetical protein
MEDDKPLGLVVELAAPHMGLEVLGSPESVQGGDRPANAAPRAT